MDKQTREKLLSVGATAEEMAELVKTEDAFGPLRAALTRMAYDSRITQEQREQLLKMVESPDMHRKIQVIDEEKAAELDSKIGERVQKLIDSGQIKRPKADKWLRDLWKKRKKK